MQINVKEARKNFSALLNNVEQGEEVVILRHGKKVARMVPVQKSVKKLPALKEFRSTIKVNGKPLSKDVLDGRDEARY